MNPASRFSRSLVASLALVVSVAHVAFSAGSHAVAAIQPASRSDTQPGNFPAEVRAALADKAIGKGTGAVTIARLSEKSGAPQIVLSINGGTPLAPASNMKVVTTSAALNILGPDFRFRTHLLEKDAVLFLIGDGDPEISAKAGWQYDTVFKQWAAQLKARGVTTLRNVYVDDSIFDQTFVNPAWPKDQLDEPYVAQVGGLNFYFNTIDIIAKAAGGAVTVATSPATSYVTVANSARATTRNAIGAGRKQGTNDFNVRGEIPAKTTETFPVTIHDPGLYGATVLLETLRREGITVTGGVGRSPNARATFLGKPSEFTVAGTLETPISVVLARCNKDSANLYAEALAKRLAAKATGQPGSWETSAATIGAYLQKIGASPTDFNLTDGCGLARDNRVTTDLMVKVLANDYAASYREAMLTSLAVGGVDGTLERRFTVALKGRVHAKSGYIRNVFCLSGYLEARNGQRYAFSILLNNIPGSGKAVHDRIVTAIDQYLP